MIGLCESNTIFLNKVVEYFTGSIYFELVFSKLLLVVESFLRDVTSHRGKDLDFQERHFLCLSLYSYTETLKN
jgi:hypothetical protein